MERKLKIVQVNALGATLSTGRTTWEMHEYFKKNNIQSYIATANGSDCAEAYAISSMPFMHLDSALSVISGLDCYHSAIQTKKFLKYLDEINPDVVHLRVLHNSYIHLGMLLKYLAKKNIATVITLHDSWFYTGKCCSPNIVPCEKWQTGCNKCPAKKMDARRRIFDRTEKMWKDKKRWLSDIKNLAIIGNSKWTTEQAKKSFLKDARMIDTVYNWIDFNVFFPREDTAVKKQLGIDGKKMILAVSSFWGERSTKGFNSFIELSRIMPDDYHIVLVGDLIYDKPLPSNMTILQKTADKQLLAQYYSAADVYLNLSESETFGKVSAEAVSCGTPVIALNNTANPEIVPDGAGEVIDSSQAQVILSALKRLFQKEKSHYKKACLEHAYNNFDKKTNIEKYIGIYKSLIDEEE